MGGSHAREWNDQESTTEWREFPVYEAVVLAAAVCPAQLCAPIDGANGCGRTDGAFGVSGSKP